MVNYMYHTQRIEEKTGQTHSADGIKENTWLNVVIIFKNLMRHLH
jgi:hypothetical protein